MCCNPSTKSSINLTTGLHRQYGCVATSGKQSAALFPVSLPQADHVHVPSRNEFVCMKSLVSDYFSVEREICAYDALSAASNASNAPGKNYVRHALDQFKIDHAGRSYHFLIHEPLGISVDFLQKTLKARLPFAYCYDLVDHMLEALEYLKHANLIHAGKYFTA